MIIEQRNVQYELVSYVASRLEKLVHDVVFIGGATVGLLLTEEGVPDVRETKDVDLIIEILKLFQYHDIDTRLVTVSF